MSLDFAKATADASSWLNYLVTDAAVLGALAWVGFALTISGLWIALYQIAKVKSAAIAAKTAAADLSTLVRSRELLLQVENGVAHLRTGRNYYSQGSRDTALLCFGLATTSVIAARELCLENETRKALDTLLTKLQIATDRTGAMSDPIQESRQFMSNTIRLREVLEELTSVSMRCRYSYADGEQP